MTDPLAALVARIAARLILDLPRIASHLGLPALPPAEAAAEIGDEGTRVVLPGGR